MGDVDPLLHLLDDARLEERRAARERQASIRRIAEEGATFAGTLLDLAERRATVVLRTVAGRDHRGTIEGVGADCLAIRSAGGAVTYVHFDAVAALRPSAPGREGVASGEREVADRRLLDVLALAAPAQPDVTVVLRGGERLAGELASVGADVVTLLLAGGQGRRCYLPAGSVWEVVFGSG